MTDILDAIRWCEANLGTTLSEKNPANFFKDIIRRKRASKSWPKRLCDLKWSARQVTGDGNVFQFVPYENDQLDPFPVRFGVRADTPKHQIQSLSIPLASKLLGRNDETYLIQVAVKLAIIETHLALHSPVKILELNHLQIGIKLKLCEVDSLFAATYSAGNGMPHQLLITCEAKKKNERIIEEQIVQQVLATFAEVEGINVVLPVAMVAESGGIHVVEFKAVERSSLKQFQQLEFQSDGLYELKPSVKGIS